MQHNSSGYLYLAAASFARIILKGTLCLLLSVLSYWLFYQLYVPRRELSVPLNFQYARNAALAQASIPIDLFGSHHGLFYDAIFDAFVADVNHQQPLMVTQRVCAGKSCSIVSQSPLIVPYRSFITQSIRSLALSVPIFLGFKNESIHIRAFIANHIQLPKSILSECDPNQSLELFVEVENPLPFENPKLNLVAHFNGLRYVMYHWRFSFSLFIIMSTWSLMVLVVLISEGFRLYLFIQNSKTPLTSDQLITFPASEKIIELSLKQHEDNAQIVPESDSLIKNADIFDEDDEGLPLLFGE